MITIIITTIKYCTIIITITITIRSVLDHGCMMPAAAS